MSLITAGSLVSVRFWTLSSVPADKQTLSRLKNSFEKARRGVMKHAYRLWVFYSFFNAIEKNFKAICLVEKSKS
ncbi:expressed protein [Phakopsora pachyrhizi]|uniref:Expressed protein n=1 Tax=Phakopsora pachyrhizi TaxID=170000 RepID=A0AAV0BNW0_PHAPC|nr:expressed protein [Phakopsora pachyrhizi]